MQFGIREICDVVLKAKATTKLGKKTFYKGEPILYFDTLKTSSLEQQASTVYAQGGAGNSRLISWDGEKTVTFTMEDALLSKESFAILAAAEIVDRDNLQVRFTERTMNVTREGDVVYIALKTAPVYTGGRGEINGNVMIIYDEDEYSEPYKSWIISPADAPAELQPVAQRGMLIGIAAEEGYAPDLDKFTSGCTVLFDGYEEVEDGEAVQINITPEILSGNYYLEGTTLFKNTDGSSVPAHFIIPNCKVQSNFTFTMASTGDPSTFTFTMDALPDYLAFDKTKKRFAAIQIEMGEWEEEEKRKRTDHTFLIPPEGTIVYSNTTTLIERESDTEGYGTIIIAEKEDTPIILNPRWLMYGIEVMDKNNKRVYSDYLRNNGNLGSYLQTFGKLPYSNDTLAYGKLPPEQNKEIVEKISMYNNLLNKNDEEEEFNNFYRLLLPLKVIDQLIEAGGEAKISIYEYPRMGLQEEEVTLIDQTVQFEPDEELNCQKYTITSDSWQQYRTALIKSGLTGVINDIATNFILTVTLDNETRTYDRQGESNALAISKPSERCYGNPHILNPEAPDTNDPFAILCPIIIEKDEKGKIISEIRDNIVICIPNSDQLTHQLKLKVKVPKTTGKEVLIGGFNFFFSKSSQAYIGEPFRYIDRDGEIGDLCDPILLNYEEEFKNGDKFLLTIDPETPYQITDILTFYDGSFRSNNITLNDYSSFTIHRSQFYPIQKDPDGTQEGVSFISALFSTGMFSLVILEKISN